VTVCANAHVFVFSAMSGGQLAIRDGKSLNVERSASDKLARAARFALG